MANILPIELQSVLQQDGKTPLELVDPRTNRAYVLLSQDQYERLRPLFEHDALSKGEQQQLLSDAGQRAGWDDPEMDAYDNYDQHRQGN